MWPLEPRQQIAAITWPRRGFQAALMVASAVALAYNPALALSWSTVLAWAAAPVFMLALYHLTCRLTQRPVLSFMVLLVGVTPWALTMLAPQPAYWAAVGVLLLLPRLFADRPDMPIAWLAGAALALSVLLTHNAGPAVMAIGVLLLAALLRTGFWLSLRLYQPWWVVLAGGLLLFSAQALQPIAWAALWPLDFTLLPTPHSMATMLSAFALTFAPWLSLALLGLFGVARFVRGPAHPGFALVALPRLGLLMLLGVALVWPQAQANLMQPWLALGGAWWLGVTWAELQHFPAKRTSRWAALGLGVGLLAYGLTTSAWPAGAHIAALGSLVVWSWLVLRADRWVVVASAVLLAAAVWLTLSFVLPSTYPLHLGLDLGHYRP